MFGIGNRGSVRFFSVCLLAYSFLVVFHNKSFGREAKRREERTNLVVVLDRLDSKENMSVIRKQDSIELMRDTTYHCDRLQSRWGVVEKKNLSRVVDITRLKHQKIPIPTGGQCVSELCETKTNPHFRRNSGYLI